MQKMLGVMFGVMCAVSVGCLASSDDSSDPAATAREPATSSGEADVSVPPELQISPRATCSSEGFSCANRNLCIANGRQESGTGCPTGQVCCTFNPCLIAGDSCASRALCAGNGTNTGIGGCATGQVCCRFN